jgi:hypothetical protein
MEFDVGSNVRAKSGDYTGYYGEVMQIDGNLRFVSLHPEYENVNGFWIDVQDLQSNE